MPSPVSPDAGVPEHQPDPRRRSGQFEPVQRSSQFQPVQRSSQFQPRTGQFPARTGATPLPPGRTQPPGPDVPSGGGGVADGKKGRRKGGGRRDWIWSVVAFLVAAGVIVAVGVHFFGPDGTDDAAAAWAVDACAGPDPSPSATAGADTYRPLLCDDPDATVSILEIQDAVSLAQLHCPAGTDVVFQKDGQAGGETQAVCARNLADDHPGDPGKGGGQLVSGDCVDGNGGELACSSDGARKVTALIVSGMECPEGTQDKLELGYDAARSFETVCLAG
ncbi:hypothetical protein [Promicromonospora sp. NPDC050262]|uniref:hypothetical protein n=1 Tax=Promicromonospora sp. NPDC050262 TaxID=3155036 RepID=UPI00340A937F